MPEGSYGEFIRALENANESLRIPILHETLRRISDDRSIENRYSVNGIEISAQAARCSGMIKTLKTCDYQLAGDAIIPLDLPNLDAETMGLLKPLLELIAGFLFKNKPYI